jgi:hypothetical protein
MSEERTDDILNSRLESWSVVEYDEGVQCIHECHGEVTVNVVCGDVRPAEPFVRGHEDLIQRYKLTDLYNRDPDRNNSRVVAGWQCDHHH